MKKHHFGASLKKIISLITSGGLLATLLVTAKAEAQVSQYRCEGDINGVPSQALVSVESLPSMDGPGRHVTVSGEIKNDYADYTFTGEMGGYVDIVSLTDGQRFRGAMNLTNNGFVLVSNPEYDGSGRGSGYYPFICSG